MVFFHFLRAASPVFSRFFKTNRPLAVLRSDRTQARKVLTVKLTPSQNISPEEVRREFAKRVLSKNLPLTPKWKPDTEMNFAQKFTISYAVADVALLFIGLGFCFWQAGYHKAPPEKKSGSDSPMPEISKPEPPKLVFSTARERTYAAAVAAKIDFTSVLATEEDLQQLSSLLKQFQPDVSTLKVKAEDFNQNLKTLAKSVQQTHNELLDVNKRLTEIEGIIKGGNSDKKR